MIHSTASAVLPAIPPRAAVLILADGDGYLRAYAERHIDLCIVPVVATQSQAAERLADDLCRLSLPPRYRDLYRADYLRGTLALRKMTVADLAAAEHERRLYACLSRIAQHEEAPVWTL